MAQAVKKRGPGGRPTKYKTEFCDRAFDFALVGMTDDEIAGALKIDRATLYRWKNAQPELCDAIKRGRDRYDTEVVEKALRQRAAGYEYTEEVMTRDGPSVLTKRFHGSDTAAILWIWNSLNISMTDKYGSLRQMQPHQTQAASISMSRCQQNCNGDCALRQHHVPCSMSHDRI